MPLSCHAAPIERCRRRGARRHAGRAPPMPSSAAGDGQRRAAARPAAGDQPACPGPYCGSASIHRCTGSPRGRRRCRTPRQIAPRPAPAVPRRRRCARPRRRTGRTTAGPARRCPAAPTCATSASSPWRAALHRRPPAHPSSPAAACRRAAPGSPAPTMRPGSAARRPPRPARRSSSSRGSRGAGTASTTPSACQRPPSSSTQVPAGRPARSTLSHRRPAPSRRRPRADQRVQQHRVAAVERAEHRPARRPRQRVAHGVGQAARAAGRVPPPASGRPTAIRWWSTHPRTRRRAADRPSRSTTCSPNRSPHQLGDRRIGTGAPGERPRPFAVDPCDRRVVDEARERRRRRTGCPAACPAAWRAVALAVDQWPHARRADLPAGQAQLGQQGRHLGPAGDERLGAHVHRLTADRVRCAARRRAGRPGRTA